MTDDGAARREPTLSPAVLAQVTAFLRELPESALTDLAEGRAGLAFVPAGPPAAAEPGATDHAPAPPGTPTSTSADISTAGPTSTTRPTDAVGGDGGTGPEARPATAPELVRARAALTAMTSREEGGRYLSSWSSRELKALAAQLEMRGVTSLRKAELVDRIIAQTIGFRLNSTAIRRR